MNINSIKNSDILEFLNDLLNVNSEFLKNCDSDFFLKFQDKQTPILTLVTCSDSRVQINSLKQDAHNEIFVVRNIGNQATNSIASLDFGIEILKTPFLLILGHSACQAIEMSISNAKTYIRSIDDEIGKIRLASDSITDAIIENVEVQIKYCMNRYQKQIADNKLKIWGAVYDIKNDLGRGYGRVVPININGTKYEFLKNSN